MLLPLTFRKALSQDADVLFELINSAYRGDSARVGWTYESDLVGGLRITPEEIHTIIISTSDWFFLALNEDKIVASIYVRDEGDCNYIGVLAVKPDLQNKSIGSRLMTAVENLSRENGKKEIRAVVLHPRKELIAYYIRKGFYLTGESEDFPPQYPAKVAGLKLLEIKMTL